MEQIYLFTAWVTPTPGKRQSDPCVSNELIQSEFRYYLGVILVYLLCLYLDSQVSIPLPGERCVWLHK